MHLLNLRKNFIDFFQEKLPAFVKEQLLDIKDPSEQDIECYEFVLSAINDPQSKLVYSPHNEERAIFWDNYDILILIEYRNITICKRKSVKKYFIDNLKLYKVMCAEFDKKIKNDIEKMQNSIKQAESSFFETVFY
jgi:hypothetical protein